MAVMEAVIADQQSILQILEKARSQERITSEEALLLLNSEEYHRIGQAADYVRATKHPEGRASFLIDRNISYTNVCVARCTFCNFYRKPGEKEGYTLSHKTIFEKIEETLRLGGTGVLLQGGMNPELKIDYYEDLLSAIRKRYPIHLHCFSPPEIVVLAKLSKISLREAVSRLKKAGLNSIPGGGAEILVESMRLEISPGKCTAKEWLEVMRVAHQEGILTTATMMIGGGETVRNRVEHLENLRELQDETGGFVAFIPWKVQLENTPMKELIENEVGSLEYLTLLAVSRLYLDNFKNIQVSWLTQSLKVAQIALRWGANDVGSIMIEENVMSTAGACYTANQQDLVRVISTAGFVPVQRDTLYQTFQNAS